nr:hypothetical protein [Candidatus Sigynarchaeota archaeon]
MSPKDISKMNKAELVKLAAASLKEREPGFKVASFSRVRAFRKKGGYRVEFSNPVIFVPQNTCGYTGAWLYQGELFSMGFDLASNPDNFTVEKPPFLELSSENEKCVKKILKSIDLPAPRDFSLDTSVHIYERDSTYDITLRTKTDEQDFTMDKRTGEVEPTLHKELMVKDDDGTTEVIK